MTSNMHTRRAATAGRKRLRSALPPGIFRWIELLGENLGAAEETFALAGSLTAIALELQRAYRTSGADVRELIWGLHRLIREPEKGAGDGEVCKTKSHSTLATGRLRS